jgi:hypothetical protein
MTSILQITMSIIITLQSLIGLVEHEGNGAEKKAQVIAQFKLWLAAAPIPPWIKFLVLSDMMIGAMVDLAVWALNKSGKFLHIGQEENPTPTPA